MLTAAAVFLAIFFPFSPAGMTPDNWYGMLICIEMAVAAVAIVEGTRATALVVLCSIALASLHALELILSPYADQRSIYSAAVPLVELVECVSLCVILFPRGIKDGRTAPGGR